MPGYSQPHHAEANKAISAHLRTIWSVMLSGDRGAVERFCDALKKLMITRMFL